MTDDAANQRRVKFYFVHNGDLDAVKLDEDEQVDDPETLYERLHPQSPTHVSTLSGGSCR